MTYKEKVAASNPPSASDFNDGDTWSDKTTGVTFKLYKKEDTAEWWPTQWDKQKQADTTQSGGDE